MEPLSQAATPSHVVMRETIPLINKPSRSALSGYWRIYKIAKSQKSFLLLNDGVTD